MTDPRPLTADELAAQYAGLSAIEHGVTTAKKATADQLRTFASSVGLKKGSLETPFGPVTLTENKGRTGPIITDEKAFLFWAEQHHPTAVETVKQFRPADRQAILAERFVCVAGSVVDSLSGEVVDFAEVHVVPAGAPTPSFGASELQRAAKAHSAQWAREAAGDLVQNFQRALPAADGDA